MTRPLLAALTLAAAANAAPPPPGLPKPPPGVKRLHKTLADALLREKPSVDPAAGRVLARVRKAYGALKSLESRSQNGPVFSIAFAQRPGLYHCRQQDKDEKLFALAVCDGATYYEFIENRKQWTERPASALPTLPLPMNVRLFFAADPAAPMLDMAGKPTVREYAYKSLGRKQINGKPTDAIRVSTMVLARGGQWHSFDSTRYFDAITGLLLRSVNGGRIIDIFNKPNATPPPGVFKWRPPAGATRAFD